MIARSVLRAALFAGCLAPAAGVACTTERYEVAPPGTDVAEPDDAGDGLDDRPPSDGVQWPDVSCADGSTMCMGECVELSSDPEHCGACGVVCGVHGECVDGACLCDSGYSFCPGGCVRLETDRNSCGTCGTVCPSGQACRRGACG